MEKAGGQKNQLMQVIKDITGKGILECKYLVEDLPSVIAYCSSEAEANKIRLQLLEAGAEATVYVLSPQEAEKEREERLSIKLPSWEAKRIATLALVAIVVIIAVGVMIYELMQWSGLIFLVLIIGGLVSMARNVVQWFLGTGKYFGG